MSLSEAFQKIAQQTPKKQPVSWIIAGLGNPGEKYENTRHNAGFMALDILAGRLSVKLDRLKFNGIFNDAYINDTRVLLLKPQTYMNLSGESIVDAASFYKIPNDRVIIISDDISLPVGKIRIRAKGSSGGHNGLKSIIAQLGTEEFPRVKIGIGRAASVDELIGWVLGKFTSAELNEVSIQAERAADAVIDIISRGVDRTMAMYN